MSFTLEQRVALEVYAALRGQFEAAGDLADALHFCAVKEQDKAQRQAYEQIAEAVRRGKLPC